MSCPGCGAQSAGVGRFCSACGAPLEVEPAEQERKQVTAMFVDIVGSMDLAEELGDERWRDVLDAFFAAATASVQGAGGLMHQFTGDGIMALFGAPVALEDHAARACHAALDIHRRIEAISSSWTDIDFRIRIGLNSGEVIVGLLGDGGQMDWAAVGHTTGIAARMESLAPPGSTAISAATAALIAGQFAVAELGTVPVKGVRKPQRVVELMGTATGAWGRVEDASRGGRLTPLVGRDAEQRVLAQALHATLEGDGRGVALIGEPGVGKSRLLQEFTGWCAEAGAVLHVAVAEPHGRSTPLRPILVLLRNFFGITAADDDVTARERVAGHVLPLDDGEDLPLVLELLGLSDPARPAPRIDPEGRQRRLLRIVGRWARAQSDTAPVVILCDDLQWWDEASLGYVAELVRVAAGARILVLATARPEHEPVEVTGDHTRHVTLSPLTGGAVQELLAALLGSDPSLDGLAELVAERAGGNPFFCHELVAALRETGHLGGTPGDHVLARDIEDLALPATVQATISARIDRLASGDKRLLYDAAVIGLEFDADLLAELARSTREAVETSLAALVTAEMIMVLDEDRHAFRHPLIREVAHHNQLAARRREAHARLVEALVRLHPDGLDEQAALLAHHSASAGRVLQAARWHVRAARWAEPTSSSMGLEHWRAARRLADEAEVSTEAARLAVEARVGILNQSWRVGADFEESRQVHREGRALLETHEAGPMLRLALDWGLYGALILTGHEHEGYEVGIQNMALAESTGDPTVVVVTAAGSTYGAFLVGRVDEAIAIADRGLDAAGGDVTTGANVLMANPYAQALLIRAICICLRGDIPTAEADLQRALDIAERHGAPEMATYARWGLALVHTGAGRSAEALEHATASLELAEAAGNTWGQTMANQAVAWARLGVGDLTGAERAALRGLELIAASGIGHHYDPVLRTALATCMLLDGRLPEAEQEIAMATRTARERGLSWAELPARIAEAHVRSAAGDPGAALAALDRGEYLADETGIRLYDRALASARKRLHAALQGQRSG